MIANSVLLQKKYAKIVSRYADKYNIKPELALNRFYRSDLYQLICSGVSDLHCMSEDYLAEELADEWSLSKHYQLYFNGVQNDQALIQFVSEKDNNENGINAGSNGSNSSENGENTNGENSVNNTNENGKKS